MAVLGFMLGLLLCLGLSSSASVMNQSENCMPFQKVVATSDSGIQVNTKVYEGSTLYRVLVPVSVNTSSVVLRAVDRHNLSVGAWQEADAYCKDSALYRVGDSAHKPFSAKWQSPGSANVSEVILQAFAVNLNREAVFSYLVLRKEETTTTLNPKISTTTSHTSTINPNTSPTLTTTPTPRPGQPTTTAKHTTSSANGAFLNPVTDTIQILLVFLVSRLLF